MAINVGPQPSSGVGGIPTKYLIIGAGVLGVGALLLMQRKPAVVDPNSGNVQPTGSTSAQLSSVQQLQLSQFGELTKLFQNQSDLIQGQIGGLSSHLDTQAAALSSQGVSQYGNLMEGFYQLWNKDAIASGKLPIQWSQDAWNNYIAGLQPASKN